MPKKQKSGLYRTKVKVGTDHTGKPIVKWVSGKTQKELEDAKCEVIAHYHRFFSSSRGSMRPSREIKKQPLQKMQQLCSQHVVW